MRYLDPTISNWTKAVTSGIDSQHVYETQVRFDMERGEFAEKLAVLASLRACVVRGDMELDEVPAWARAAIELEQARGRQLIDGELRLVMGCEERAPAPAPADCRYSTHVERRMTRKRRQAAHSREIERQQAQERQRDRSVEGLHRLVEAWGARVKGEIAPLRRG